MDKLLFAKSIYEQVNQERDRLALKNNWLLTIYTAIISATIGGLSRFISNINDMQQYSKSVVNAIAVLFILSLSSGIIAAYFYFTFMLNNSKEYLKIDTYSNLILNDLKTDFICHGTVNRNLTDKQIIFITNNLFDVAKTNDKRNHAMSVCQIKILYCIIVSAALSIIAYCIML